MDYNELFRQLAEYTRLKEEAETAAEAIKQQLRAYMAAQHLETLAGTEHKATLKTVVSVRLDTAALKKARPEIAAEFSKRVEAQRFTFV